MLASTCTLRSAHLSLSTLLAAAIVFGVLRAAPAFAALPGSVYTQTNGPVNNAVVVFTRAANGTLSESSRVGTGGNGDDSIPPFGFAILDSQGGVDLSDSEHLVFAVNAGSDTLSSFRVRPGGGLVLVGSVPTGDLPVSVDSHGDLVYVLNEESGTIQGYRAAADGQLTSIAGSVEPLSVTGSPAPAAAEISFDVTGRVLTVTHRFPVAPATTDRIDTFVLGADSRPEQALVNDAEGAPGDGTGLAPFGFAYDGNGHAIVANSLDGDGSAGSISSYQLNTTTGALTFLDNEPTAQFAPSWVVITPDNRYAFVANTDSGSVTRLQLVADGTLTALGQTAVLGAGSAADVALSPDGRYLTVLVPTVSPGGPDTSQTDTYEVGVDGGLTLLDPGGQTTANLAAGVSGLAASGADSAAPDTTISSGLAAGSLTNDNTPTFAFAAVPATEPNPTFTCSVDGVGAAPCTTPFTTASLAEGAHTFLVAATDFGGNTDATPATRVVIVDTVAPETTIDAGLPDGATTNDNTPTFEFAASEAGSAFECRVDAGAFSNCSSPLTATPLPDGQRTFEVRATDPAANTDRSPASRTFTVRTQGPVVVPPPAPPDVDGDGILDPLDECPREDARARDANRNGCLDYGRVRGRFILSSRKLVRVSDGKRIAIGVRVTRLVGIGVSRGAVVELTCTRRTCRRGRRQKVGAGGRVSISRLNNRRLPIGTRVRLRVTLPGAVGLGVEYTIKPRGLDVGPKRTFCIRPGSGREGTCSTHR